MAGKMVLLLAAVLALTDAASITYPTRSNLDVNFNNFGFKFGAKFNNKAQPKDGGKVFMEIPMNMAMRILKGEPSLVRQLLVPFKEESYVFYQPSFFERLYDVVNMKMEIDYDAKNFKSGVMTANAKYIITHHDYTQETGTIKIEGDGKNVVLQVIPKEEVLTKTVFRPVEVKFTFMPKQLKMVFTQEKMTFETFFVQRGQVFETQMTYKSEFEPTCQMTMRMDVGKQKIEFTRSENDVMKTNMVLEMQGSRGANFEQLTGTMKLTGTMEATRWWTEGTPVDFVIKKNGKTIDGSFTFNNFKFGKFNMDWNKKKFVGNMYMKEGIVVVNFDASKGEYEITFPKEWFYDMKSLKMKMTETNNHKTWDMVLMRENVEFYTMKMDMKDTKLWNKMSVVVSMETKNADMVDSFFYIVGVSKYRFCNKLVNGCFKKGKYSMVASKDGNFKVEVEKEDVKVMMMKLKFAPRTMDMEFFYPRFFQKTLNKPFETLTMKMMMDDKWKSCKVETNFENMKMEMTRAGGNMWKQTFHFIATRNGEMMTEYNLKYDIGMMQKPTTFESEYNLNEKSMTHRMLCDYSTHLCFKNLKESFMYNPKTYNMDHTITKDTKNVLDFHTKFENGKLKSFIWNTPYLVPFYRYMTTRRSLFNRYFNPMPMMLTPFEVKVDVAGTTKITTNWDMHKTSMEIKPMGSDKYQLIYKSGQMTQKYEFTMTDKKIEYGQFKAWRDNKSIHFAWTTEDGVPQTFDIKYDQKFVTFTVDFKNIMQGQEGGFQVKQEWTMFMPFNTGKEFFFFWSWEGKGEMPYVKTFNNKGSLGMWNADSGKTTDVMLTTEWGKFSLMQTASNPCPGGKKFIKCLEWYMRVLPSYRLKWE